MLWFAPNVMLREAPFVGFYLKKAMYTEFLCPVSENIYKKNLYNSLTTYNSWADSSMAVRETFSHFVYNARIQSSDASNTNKFKVVCVCEENINSTIAHAEDDFLVSSYSSSLWSEYYIICLRERNEISYSYSKIRRRLREEKRPVLFFSNSSSFQKD